MTQYQWHDYKPTVFDASKAALTRQALQSGQIKNQSAQMDLSKKQKDLDTQAKLQQQMKGYDPNTPEGSQRMSAFHMEQGNVPEMQAMKTSQMDVQAKQGNIDMQSTQKQSLELTNSQKAADQVRRKLGAISDVLGQVEDQNQYDQGREMLKQSGFDVSKLPEGYEESIPVVAHMRALAIGLEGQLRIDGLKATLAGQENKVKLEKAKENAAYQTLASIFGEEAVGKRDKSINYETVTNNFLRFAAEGRMRDAMKIQKDKLALNHDLLLGKVADKKKKGTKLSPYANKIMGEMAKTKDSAGYNTIANPGRENDIRMLYETIKKHKPTLGEPGIINFIQRIDAQIKRMFETTGKEMLPGDYLKYGKKILGKAIGGQVPETQADPVTTAPPPMPGTPDAGLPGPSYNPLPPPQGPALQSMPPPMPPMPQSQGAPPMPPATQTAGPSAFSFVPPGGETPVNLQGMNNLPSPPPQVQSSMGMPLPPEQSQAPIPAQSQPPRQSMSSPPPGPAMPPAGPPPGPMQTSPQIPGKAGSMGGVSEELIRAGLIDGEILLKAKQAGMAPLDWIKWKLAQPTK